MCLRDREEYFVDEKYVRVIVENTFWTRNMFERP